MTIWWLALSGFLNKSHDVWKLRIAHFLVFTHLIFSSSPYHSNLAHSHHTLIPSIHSSLLPESHSPRMACCMKNNLSRGEDSTVLLQPEPLHCLPTRKSASLVSCPSLPEIKNLNRAKAYCGSLFLRLQHRPYLLPLITRCLTERKHKKIRGQGPHALPLHPLEGPSSITRLLIGPASSVKMSARPNQITLPWTRGPLGDISNSNCNIWKTQTMFTLLFHFLWEMECFMLFCSPTWRTLVSKYFPMESYKVVFEGILNANCSVALADTGPSRYFNSSFVSYGPNATTKTGIRWPARELAAWASRRCL